MRKEEKTGNVNEKECQTLERKKKGRKKEGRRKIGKEKRMKEMVETYVVSQYRLCRSV